MATIVHTADWHLGARLVDRDRLAEQLVFLEWLGDLLAAEKADLLLVAGDVFDTANPPHEAVEAYYRFLTRLARLGHCAAVIIGGNHDSASHLNAPRELLSQFRIHVFGAMPENPADAVLEFPGFTVCAVPFLRERDLRRAVAGEAATSAAEAVRKGIAATYAQVHALAAARGKPIIATGHLTVSGAVVCPESERDIHVGNLGAVGPEIFSGFDYVALGHLHGPQGVGLAEHIRYSGSPLPLSFAEVGQVKEVPVIYLEKGKREIESRRIPCWRRLVRLESPAEQIPTKLTGVAATNADFPTWVEIRLPAATADPVQQRQWRDTARGLAADILKITSPPSLESFDATWQQPAASLEDMQAVDVFQERLRSEGLDIDSPESAALQATFLELLAEWEKRRLA